MRKRDVGVPLLLFLPLAAWVHLMFAGGGYQVASVYEGIRDIEAIAVGVRQRVQMRESEVDIELLSGEPTMVPEEPDPHTPLKEQEKKKNLKQAEEKKNQPDEKLQKKEIPLPPSSELEAKKKEEEQQLKNRLAVKQHVKPNQEDHPNARFAADEANHTQEETVAKQTALDQDEKDPSKGAPSKSPLKEQGDSEDQRIRDSEDRKGEKSRPAGESGSSFALQNVPRSAKEAQTGPKHEEKSSERTASLSERMAKAPSASEGAQSESATPSNEGTWTFRTLQNPNASNGGGGAKGEGLDAKGASRESLGSTSWLGLGAQVEEGKVNLNLSHSGVVASLGEASLAEARVADGERRKSAHRGSWQASNFDKWRSAIENYVSSVKTGNQTALNAARVPFATYLHGMHLRIHPIFADTFLGTLDSLPATHPLSNFKLFTRVEFVLNPKEGSVKKLGIVRASGVTAFDIAALDAVSRAAPYGPAPSAIVSKDGNVYLQWEFHRDDTACMTTYARPYLLQGDASQPTQKPLDYPAKGPIPNAND